VKEERGTRIEKQTINNVKTGWIYLLPFLDGLANHIISYYFQEQHVLPYLFLSFYLH
jgi:hypothetical protein